MRTFRVDITKPWHYTRNMADGSDSWKEGTLTFEEGPPGNFFVFGAGVVVVNEKGQILTKVRTKKGDPFDGLTEAITERTNQFELTTEIALRSVQEELGDKTLVPKFYGLDGHPVNPFIFENPGNIRYVLITPVPLLEAMDSKGTWIAACFIAVVPDDLVLRETPESKGLRWWLPNDLLKEIESNRSTFTPLAAAMLTFACHTMVNGEYRI